MSTRERFIGANWRTPAHIVPLIEMVRADKTSDDTARRLYDFFESVGKKPVVINREVKGFVGNRIQFAVMREAMNIVENGYASMEDVDRVLHYGLGLRYAAFGPFRTADFGGADTFCHICETLFPDLCNRETANDITDDLYDNGKYGIKTGEGFYSYTPEEFRAAACSIMRAAQKLLSRNCCVLTGSGAADTAPLRLQTHGQRPWVCLFPMPQSQQNGILRTLHFPGSFV